MKATRKLIPAIALLLISALLLSTATFAWFTNNQTVTVSGIKMTAKAPISLYIRQASTDTTGANFDSSAVFHVTSETKLYPLTYADSAWKTAVGQTRTNGAAVTSGEGVIHSIGTENRANNVLTGNKAPDGSTEENAKYAIFGDFDFYTTAVESTKKVVLRSVSIDKNVAQVMYKAITLKFFTLDSSSTETSAISVINLKDATVDFDEEEWLADDWATLETEWETTGAGAAITDEDEKAAALVAYKAEQKALAIAAVGTSTLDIDNDNTVVVANTSKDAKAPSKVRVYAYFDGAATDDSSKFFIQDDNFVEAMATLGLTFDLVDNC